MDLPENDPFKWSPVSLARDPPLSLTAACWPLFRPFDHQVFYVAVPNTPAVYRWLCTVYFIQLLAMLTLSTPW